MARLAHTLLALLLLLGGCAGKQQAAQTAQGGAPQPAPPPPVAGLGLGLPAPPAVPGVRPLLEHAYFADQVTGTYAYSPALHAFIQRMVRTHGFSEHYLNGLFSTANRLHEVIKLESPAPGIGPAQPKAGSWSRYRGKFLTDAHIKNGAEFWRKHYHTISRASTAYGVDPEYIVAIIGVETYFGKNIGKTNVFDALTTLAFDTPRRSKFFSSELEHFLLMAREEGFDPRKPVGSWAGAMGLGQFMPSSFRRLAIDFNRDGHRDLWDPQDAIGSVARYFSSNGWRRKAPVAYPAAPASADNIVELSTYEGMEHWRVYPNFKVIKRYNNSNKYAMAVHQLAQAIKQRHQVLGMAAGD